MDPITKLFQEIGLDGRVLFGAVLKDYKGSEPGCLDLTLRTQVLHPTEHALISALHRIHIYIAIKPMNLGNMEASDLTLLDLGSENLDLNSSNKLIALQAAIMMEYRDQGPVIPWTDYLNARIESLIKTHFEQYSSISKNPPVEKKSVKPSRTVVQATTTEFEDEPTS